MKVLIALFMLTFSLLASNLDMFASQMKYFRDYQPALAQAKKENKMIMLVLVADYCPWCRKMERKTLKAPTVSAFIQEHYVPVIVDRNLDKESYPKAYDTPRIPVIFFIDPITETHLYESIAYVKKKDFTNILEEVLLVRKRETKK